MVVQLSIPVAEADRLIGLGYSHIEIWQSEDEGNTYAEVTAAAASAGYVDSLVANTTFRMGGCLLKFVLDGGSEISVIFSSLLTYWTATQVAARVNEVAAGRASVVDGALRITSPTTGRSSSVAITYSDSTNLGLIAGALGIGKAGRVPLVPDVLLYTFADQGGALTDRYKWRFSANGGNPIGEFAERVFPQTVPVADLLLSVGFARFVGVDGRPVQRTILVCSVLSPTMVGDYAIGDESTRPVTTDEEGLLQLPLVRGARVRVAIEGTSYVREFTVPDSETFDLMTTMAAAPDPFTVQVAPPLLTRRNI